MAGATVPLLLRVAGSATITPPALTAGGMHLLPWTPTQIYMPHPDGMGDVTWQGAQFGFSAAAGANITYAGITVTHRVSDVNAYDLITAQIYASGSPVGTPATFTPSTTYITETVSVTGGITQAALPTLAVQVTFHQVAMGMAYVHQAYAAVNYSFADSVGIITVAGTCTMTAPTVTVHPPHVTLVGAGTAGQNLSPVFAQPTTAGNMLLAWVFSNSSVSTFDTTCNDPSWTLVRYNGGAFAWISLWQKTRCKRAETPPQFTTGASTPLTQLLEFSGVTALDQAGIGTTGSDPRVTTLTTASRDTRSGDLVFGVCVWPGANPTPATVTLTGTDSSGTTLTLNKSDNSATAGQIPWATGWAQASAPAGPGQDTITGSVNIFDFGDGIIASFWVNDPVRPAPALYAMSRFSGSF